MEQTAIELESRLRAMAGGYLGQAQGLEVTNQETSTSAQIVVAKLKAVIKEWKAYWKEPKEKAKAAHAILCQREAELLDRIEPAIKFLSEKIVAWTVAEREKARIAQEARDKAEWEQRRRDEEATKKIENVGSFEEAAEILAKAEPTKPMPPAVAAPRMDEGQLRDHWKFRVINFEDIPRRYLMTDDQVIREKINSIPNKTEESVKDIIPGIEIYNEPLVAQKRQPR